jgi:Hint module
MVPVNLCIFDAKFTCSGTTLLISRYDKESGCTGTGNTTVTTNADKCYRSGDYYNNAQCLKTGGGQSPTSQYPTSQDPTSQGPTSQGPTSQGPTSQGPTSQGPTSQGPTSQGPTLQGPTGPITATNSTTRASAADAATCFAADELVQKENGENISISEVRVGDRVLSASGSGLFTYADVIAVPHRKNDKEASFIVISAATTDIKLTTDHYLMAGMCGYRLTLQKASA